MTEMTNGDFFSTLVDVAKSNSADAVEYLENAIDNRFARNAVMALSKIYSLATGSSYQGAQPNVSRMVIEIGTALPDLAQPMAAIVITRDLNVFKP